MQTSTLSRLSAGTPKTVDPFAGFWDDAGFAEICPTAHAGRDFPGRPVHAHQISKRWSEERSGFVFNIQAQSVSASLMKINRLRDRWILARHNPAQKPPKKGCVTDPRDSD